jgi:hypothetical protein
MEPRDIHLLWPLGYFEQLQDADALSDLVGADPASCTYAVKLFKSFVPEATDHDQSVNILVYSVKSRIECEAILELPP